MSEKIAVSICVCTFRRPHIAYTLRSVLDLEIDKNSDVRVIVADNDDTDSARGVVEEVAQAARDKGIIIDYIHAPARNISVARNACLDAAKTPLIAFIDDDELVTTFWLKAMLSKLDNSGADVVLGPVRAIYSNKCEEWLRKGDFHSTYPVWVGDKIITGYSCNVLIKLTSPTLKELRFRHNLGKTGGEDTVYFSSLHNAGAVITYAPDAIVTELVTPEREKLSWLIKRRFRSGQTHGLLLLEDNSNIKQYSKNIIEYLLKLLICIVTTLANFLRPAKMRFWLLRGAFHMGVIAKLLGKKEIIQYG